MDDSPSCVLRIDGGLSPLGNLELDDTIHWTQQELTVIRRVRWVKKESG